MKEKVLVSGNVVLGSFFILSAILIISHFLFYGSFYWIYFFEGLFSKNITFFQNLTYLFPESIYFILTPFLLYFLIKLTWSIFKKKPIQKNFSIAILLIITCVLFLVATVTSWSLYFVHGFIGLLGIHTYSGQTTSVYVFLLLHFFTLCLATVSSFLSFLLYWRKI